MFPTDDIGNALNTEWVALNLNIENCFDFDYTPSEGDNLIITQNEAFSPRISFIYKQGIWVADHYSPFLHIRELIREGNVSTTKNDAE